MDSFFSTETEREVVQILWEEASTFGGPHGKKLLERSALVAGDFTDASGRALFALMSGQVASGASPSLPRSHASHMALQAFLSTDELRNPNALDAKAAELRDLSGRRAIVRFAKELLQRARDPELCAEDLLHFATTGAKSMPSRSDNWRPLTEAVERVQKHVVEVMDGRKQATVATGFGPVDRTTGGLPPTLIVIAAMPGVGKSALEASIIRNMAMRGDKAVIFCMEDMSDWLAFRFLAHESNVSQTTLRYHPLSGAEHSDVGAAFSRLGGFDGNILCDDRAALSPADVLHAARRAISAHGAKAIFLDNMTAMKFQRSHSRMDLEIQDFLVEARAMANETGVPFVVLSHIRRRDGLDVDDLPGLTDCSETSAFEKLARVAYVLCRDRETNEITLGVVKNTSGPSYKKFKLGLRPTSAMVEAEVRRADEREQP